MDVPKNVFVGFDGGVLPKNTVNPFEQKQEVKITPVKCNIAAAIAFTVAAVALAIFIIAMFPPAAALIIPAAVSLLAVQITSGVVAVAFTALGIGLLCGGCKAKEQIKHEKELGELVKIGNPDDDVVDEEDADDAFKAMLGTAAKKPRDLDGPLSPGLGLPAVDDDDSE